MNFGQAVEKMKDGEDVTRKGWNGKGMFVFLHKFHIDMVSDTKECIVMFTGNKEYQPGWLASQADILAEDWEVSD